MKNNLKKILKAALWLLTVPLAFLLFLIGSDVYEYFNPVCTMRKP